MNSSFRIALLGLFALSLFGGPWAFGAEPTHSSGESASESTRPEEKDAQNDPEKQSRQKVEDALQKLEDLEKIDDKSAADLTVEDLLDHESKLKEELKALKDAGEPATEEDKKKKEQAELELAKIDKILTARTPVLGPYKDEIKTKGDVATTTPATPTTPPAGLSTTVSPLPPPNFGPVTVTRTETPSLGSAVQNPTVQRPIPTVPQKPMAAEPVSQPRPQSVAVEAPQPAPALVVTNTVSNPPAAAPAASSSDMSTWKFNEGSVPPAPTPIPGGRYEAPQQTVSSAGGNSSAGRAVETAPQSAAPASITEIATPNASASVANAGAGTSSNLDSTLASLSSSSTQPLVLNNAGSNQQFESVLAAAEQAKFFSGVGVTAPSSSGATSSGRAVAEKTAREEFQETIQNSNYTSEPLELAYNAEPELSRATKIAQGTVEGGTSKANLTTGLQGYRAKEIAQMNLDDRVARGVASGPKTNGISTVKGGTSMKALSNSTGSKEVAGDLTKFANTLGLN